MSQANTEPLARPMGVIPGMSFESYLAVDAASSHRLIDMMRSPAHCRWNIDNPKKQTDDLKIGTACHDCILSPETFPASWVVSENCSSILQSGKRAGQCCGAPGKIRSVGSWYCGMHSGGLAADPLDDSQVLTLEQHEKVTSAADAVMSHPTVREMLELTEPDDRELSIFWIDAETGVYCKARVDALARKIATINDLKSARCAQPGFWIRQAKTLGYDLQGAFYLEACTQAGIEVDAFKSIVFEKEGPYCVNWAHFDPEILKLAARANQACLRRYAECLASGEWPGYDENGFIVKANQWDEIRVNELEAAQCV